MSEQVRTGSCACGEITYKMKRDPFIVQACHCTDCQKLSGGPFVINAWIEASEVKLTSGKPKTANLKGGSGKRHELSYCGNCATQIWSNYHAAVGDTRFVRVQTLDSRDNLPTELHIWTHSKSSDTEIPDGVTVFPEFYDLKKTWTPEKFERFVANMQKA